MAYKLETVIKNAVNTIGEAPHWDETTQTLLFVDILAGNVHRYNTRTKIEDKRHLDGPVSLVVPRKSGGYVVANNLNLSHLDWESGSLSVLATSDEIPGSKFNDGKCDDTGRLWVGTLGPNLGPMNFTPEAGSLYTLDNNLSFQKRQDKITLSNGMAWTNNNTKMFHVNTQPREIYSYNFDLSSGNLSNKQVLVKFPENTLDSMGYPDGMVSDVDDKLWCAFIFGGCILRLDQETGQEISRINFPTKQITSCCWGGKNFDELYVTCASREPYDDESGSVFRVTNLGTRGRRAEVFCG